MTTARQFGQLLIDLRLAAGLKVGFVAKQVKVYKTFLFRLERGWEGLPSSHLIGQFAELYGVDRDALFVAAGRIPPELYPLASSLEGVKLLRAFQQRTSR